MIRTIIESIYYASARLMPLRFQWQWSYVSAARWYFDFHKQDNFSGWPWAWSLTP